MENAISFLLDPVGLENLHSTPPLSLFFEALFIIMSALESRRPSYEAQFDHLLVVLSWVGYLTSLSCSLLIHEKNNGFVKIKRSNICKLPTTMFGT